MYLPKRHCRPVLRSIVFKVNSAWMETIPKQRPVSGSRARDGCLPVESLLLQGTGATKMVGWLAVVFTLEQLATCGHVAAYNTNHATEKVKQ